jgi:hypothetical protein
MGLVSRTFDQLIDFTRASAGTFVNSAGNIVSTPASRNLLTFTQQFDNAAWTKSNATVFPNQNPAAASLGGELVTNGDFSSGSTGWALGTDWTVSGGFASRGADATASNLTGGSGVVAGRLYQVTWTQSAQTVAVYLGTVLGPLVSNTASAGTYTRFVLATVDGGVVFRGNGAISSIDNVSVREVIGGWNLAPDGTLTADTLLANAGTASRNLNQSGGGSGSALTFSVYAKAGTSNFIQLYHGASSNTFANFNLSTGAVATVGSSATAAIVSVGNGWYRCSMTCTPGSASASRIAMITSAVAAYNESWTAAGTESVLLWGAQLELGTTATDYTRNVGGLFPPRFDYDPVTRAPRGLLIEEQRTNLLLRSEEFDNASWTKNFGGVAAAPVVTANAAVSPDGTMDADRVQFSLGGGTTATDISDLRQVATTTAASHTFSLWVRSFDGTSSYTMLVRDANGITNQITVTGTWARYTVAATYSAGSSTVGIGIRGGQTPANSNTADILIWGAQLEAGAFATSYIPTTSAQVTRSADIATITGANFSQFYNQSEGTFVVSLTPRGVPLGGNNVRFLEVNDGTGNNRNPLLFASSTGTAFAQYRVAGVDQASTPSSVGYYASGVPIQIGAAYAVNNFATSFSGGTVQTDTSGSVVTTATQMTIGSATSGAGAEVFNGHIRSIRYYPSRLSNATLQSLTA